MYNIHNTNLERPPHVKSLIPRKPNEKFKSSNPKPRYNGPLYLPKHIYHMLSEDVKKALDKYNQEKNVQYKPNHTGMAKVHEQVLQTLIMNLINQNLIWPITVKRTPTPCSILRVKTS